MKNILVSVLKNEAFHEVFINGALSYRNESKENCLTWIKKYYRVTDLNEKELMNDL